MVASLKDMGSEMLMQQLTNMSSVLLTRISTVKAKPNHHLILRNQKEKLKFKPRQKPILHIGSGIFPKTKIPKLALIINSNTV